MTNQTITQLCEPESAAEKLEQRSPFILEFFLVQGVNFKCMAYRDNEGRWRGAFDNEELPGSIRILE